MYTIFNMHKFMINSLLIYKKCTEKTGTL